MFTFRIVGIDAAPLEFPPQVGTSPGAGIIWATPAFVRGYRVQPGLSIAVLRLRPGADVSAVQRELNRLAHGTAGSFSGAAASANTQRSIHLQAVALWLLAAFLGVIGVLVSGQLLARLSLVESGDYGVLSALGMNRRQLIAVGLGRSSVIGAAAAGLAAVLAVAVSPLFPVGLARVAEPQPGLNADWLVLAIGGLATVVATVACAARPAARAATITVAAKTRVMDQRRRSLVARAAGIGSVPRALGIRLALQPGAGPTALPIRSTIAGAVVGVTALSAALVFSASLDRLFTSPRWYGVTWDASIVGTNIADVTPAMRTVARDPRSGVVLRLCGHAAAHWRRAGRRDCHEPAPRNPAHARTGHGSPAAARR